MATITVRELARNTAAVIQLVESTGRPALVTRNGRPVAALVALDETALEDWLLSRAPEFTRAGADGDGDLQVGRMRSDEWQKARRASGGRPRRSAARSIDHLRGSHRGD